jgi:hypothetical protein
MRLIHFKLMTGFIRWSVSWMSLSAMTGSESYTQQGSCEAQLSIGGSPTHLGTPRDRDALTWVQFRERFRNHHIPVGVMKMKHKEFLALKQVNYCKIFLQFLFELKPTLVYLREIGNAE